MNVQNASCTITTALIESLRAHAAADAPLEACGLLIGTPEQILRAEPTRNVAANPARQFEIDPAALLRLHREARGAGQSVIGWYHSHPDGSAVPSKTDAARAAEDGMLWLIVTTSGVSAWRAAADGDLHGRFTAVRLDPVPAATSPGAD